MANNYVKIKQIYDNNYGSRMKYLLDYYNGDTPIKSRLSISEAKASSHTNLHVDFFGDIVNLKSSYMGNKITYNVKDERVADELKKISRVNQIEIMNQQSIAWSTIQGLSHRLIYSEDGLLKMKNIRGDQVIYKYKSSVLDPEEAYYYWSEVDLEGNVTDHLDVYNKENVIYHKLTGAGYTTVGDPQPHNFKGFVPIVPLLNNEDITSDCSDSTELMDQYDAVASDIIGEIKAIRSAYLKIWGNLNTGTDSEGNEIPASKWLEQTGTFHFGTNDEGKPNGDVSFLEKNINDAAIENCLTRLRASIFETSGSIDIQSIASTERLYSARVQMMRLENTCANTERWAKAFLYRVTEMICAWLSVYESIEVDPSDIEWIFTRSFPRDIESEANILSQLTTTLTIEDSLKAIGFDDADNVAKRANEKPIREFASNMDNIQ